MKKSAKVTGFVTLSSEIFGYLQFRNIYACRKTTSSYRLAGEETFARGMLVVLPGSAGSASQRFDHIQPLIDLVEIHRMVCQESPD